MEIKKEYIKFVENYIPFEWEIKEYIKNKYYELTLFWDRF